MDSVGAIPLDRPHTGRLFIPEIAPVQAEVAAVPEAASAQAAVSPEVRAVVPVRTAEEIAREAFDRSFGGVWNAVRTIVGFGLSGEAQHVKAGEWMGRLRKEAGIYATEAKKLVNETVNGAANLIAEGMTDVVDLGVEATRALVQIPATGIGVLAEAGASIMQQADSGIDRVVDGGNAMMHEVAGRVLVRPFEVAAALVSGAEGFNALGELVEQADKGTLEPEKQALHNGREAVGGALMGLREWLTGVVRRGNEYRQAAQTIRAGMAVREAGRRTWLAESKTYFREFASRPLSTLFGWSKKNII